MRFERDANGELIVMSPTGTGGGRIESRVYLALGNWAVADGRGEAYGPTTGFKLPDNSVRAADAAWMSSLRWDALDAEELKRFARACPEFVIEIRSESDRLAPLQEKMQMWIDNGAEVAWLIDPIEKAVTIYRPGDEPEHLAHPTSVQGTGPIARFELVMARIWD
jgi:Uma2 family endonuclease